MRLSAIITVRMMLKETLLAAMRDAIAVVDALDVGRRLLGKAEFWPQLRDSQMPQI